MNSRKTKYFSAALIMMIGVAALILWLKSTQRLGEPGVKMDLPETVLHYQSTNLSVTAGEKEALPKDTQISRRLYTAIENQVTNQLQLTIVLMGADRTSIHNPKFCLTGEGWLIEKEELVDMPIAQPHNYRLPAMKITASKQVELQNGQMSSVKAIYLYWFVAKDNLAALHGERMWKMTRSLLTQGILQRWAYVSCFTVCWPGYEAATFDRMQRFLKVAVPEFQLTAGKPVSSEDPIRTK